MKKHRAKAPLTRGVMYYNVGTSCIVRILVSLHSLRKHYQGAVTICSEGADSNAILGKMDLSSLNATVKDITDVLAFVPQGDSHTYLKTTLAVRYAPYDLNIWLDADTLVRGPIDELFDLAEKHEIVVPNFANWGTQGKTISRRIQRWQPFYPEHIEKALQFGPATNCGVQAFSKTSKFMHDWYEKTLPGREIYICNETCQQVLLHLYPHKIIDQKFNCSCRYSTPKDPDTRVIHYHGRKHCRIGLPNAGDLWMAEYKETLADNVGNIKDITPLGDRMLRRFLDHEKNGGSEAKKDIQLNLPNIDVKFDPSNFSKDSHEFTIVTGVTPNYLDKLKLTAPTWNRKKQFQSAPLLVFANGFDDPEADLEFLYDLKDEVTIVDWDMPQYDSKRELMLSAFIIGAATEVKTPYCVKMDCDSFFLDDRDVFLDHHFNYDLAASRWLYTKPGRWIVELDAWAEKMGLPGNRYLKDDQVPIAAAAKRFGHRRIASWICLQKTDFVIEAAKLAGKRLPVASHDTYMWYLAERLPNRSWAQHKFKKQGAGTSTHIDLIRERIANSNASNAGVPVPADDVDDEGDE